ncbi:MAG: hypothetical protein GY899_08920 [Verrucomicrobiaceae bacterium]|nr:hypothetical protein [Verrucomicrobiaceae bacterium]
MGALSLVTFAASLVTIPFLVARLGKDHFIREQDFLSASGHWLARGVVLVGRTLLGVCLLLAGIVMLFVPGQGILTMLIGLVVLEFPGKAQLQSRILRCNGLKRSLNWIRARKGKEDFLFP